MRALCLLLCLALSFAGKAFAKDVYIVAQDCTWPPMEMLNAAKEPEGYSTDFLRAAAKAAGFEVECRNAAWDGILGGLATGQYDMVASSVTIMPERQKQFDFSEPYYEVVQAVVLPAGQSVQSLAQLGGKKVGGQIGTTGIFVLRKAGVPADIREYDDIGLAMQDLLGGRIDAVICDDPVARYYANKKAGYAGRLNMSFKTEEKEYYGFVVKKGNKELLAKLNRGIALVKEAGLDAQLAEKWMGK